MSENESTNKFSMFPVSRADLEKMLSAVESIIKQFKYQSEDESFSPIVKQCLQKEVLEWERLLNFYKRNL